MKIEITTTETVKKTIDVEFPYYYEHNLYSDYGTSIIYGKILPEYAVTIHEKESFRGGEVSYEIERGNWDGSYFHKEFISSKEEFEAVKQRALDFLSKI